MIKCDNCGENSKPKEKTYRYFNYRPKTYINQKIIMKGRKKEYQEYKTEGKEASGEIVICKDCHGN
jgi:hypothetical protein